MITGLREVATAYDLTPEQLLAATALVIHGTTVATNTLVERKGARVGLLTTAGFRDLLEMREGMKEDRYNLRMTPVEPLVRKMTHGSSLGFFVRSQTRASGASELASLAPAPPPDVPPWPAAASSRPGGPRKR